MECLMTTNSRIRNQALRSKIMSAKEAVALIENGDNVGMSGFTGAGYPKATPLALAERINAIHLAGEKFKIGVWTGASTAPELDGALAKVDGVELRLPYQSDPTCRKRINAGEMDYIDIHLSHVAQFVWSGFLGKLNVAIVEVAGVREDGSLIPPRRSATTRPGWTRPTRSSSRSIAGRTWRWRGCTTFITARNCRPSASRSRSRIA